MSNNENQEMQVKNPNLNAAVKQGKKAATTVIKESAGNALRAWITPLLPWILGIAAVLIIVVGIIMFFLSGVGLIFESVKLAMDDFGTKVQSWWYGGSQYVVPNQEIIDVADQLETMGYDLKGYGFLSDSVSDDDKKISGLKRNVSLNDITVDSSGIARDEKGITNIKSKNIKQYLISSNYMYTLYNTNKGLFSDKNGFIRLYNDGGSIGNKASLYEPSSSLLSFLARLFNIKYEDIQIRINTENKTLEIASVSGVFWWKHVNTFKYNLEGWTGRYGMPLEFLLSVHLASMQPDLAYEMTEQFPTHVNILLHPVTSTITAHINIGGTDYTSGSLPTYEQWQALANPVPPAEGEEPAEPEPTDDGSDGVMEPTDSDDSGTNGYATHDYYAVKSALSTVDNSFSMVFPYIGDVTEHWFRDVYFATNNPGIRFIKNDQEFEYNTGERWTDYETATDSNGKEYYVLYVVNPDGTLGDKYNGTIKQAEEEGIKVSKRAKTESVGEGWGGHFSAYSVKNNEVLINNTELTPDVVGGEDKFNSIPYHDEITYEARTSEYLNQVRDGERGETNLQIKKMLTQYYYYTYNGQRERADAIKEDKAKVGEYHHEDSDGHIIDGTSSDPRDKNLIAKFTINSDALTAFKLLENMNTVDSDEIYRDFKELIVELNYFDKEDFAGNATDVFQWPVPDAGTAGWPVREVEKPNNVFGTLINSRVNLLNLKNLFLQYREDEEEEVPNQENQGNQENPNDQPTDNNQEEQEPDGATTNESGDSYVDKDGYSTPAWEEQVRREEEEVRKRREAENYTPGEYKKDNKQDTKTDSEQEGVQGESEGRNAGGGVTDPNRVTEDFIKAEDESGNAGWIDTYDIVMDNLGYNHAHPGYSSNERSYLSFMRGLGGVFAEYCGDENNGEGTFEDFVAACQYMYGLAQIYGFEYCNGTAAKCDPHQMDYFGDASNSPNDAYRESGVGHSHLTLYGGGAKCSGCHNRLLDDTMIAQRYVTNCNYTTDKVFYKAGLFDRSDSSCSWGSLIAKYGGNYVYRTSELQVGDLIEHFDGGGWTHVSFVGEINDDEIVVYETGHAWTNKGDFRFVYNRFTDKPTGHDTWFGVHLFDLQPRNRDEYEGFDGNVDVVSPITGEVIDAGERTITNIQTNEIETIGYIKIRAIVAGDIGTSIPDTNISNMEDPDTKVAKLKTGTHEEQKEYKYGGYKLFMQEYEAANVSGFILYMEGFDLRLFENDGNRKNKNERTAMLRNQFKTMMESLRIGMLRSIIAMLLGKIHEKF